MARPRTLYFLMLFAGCEGMASTAAVSPSALLNPALLMQVRDEREIYTSARLTDEPTPTASGKPQLERYRLVTVMQASASVDRVKQVLEDCAQYEKLIPYVSKSEFDPKTRLLTIEGGIWNYRMMSRMKFDPPEAARQRFVVVSGHFQGLVGVMSYERAGERGSLVSLEAETLGSHFPPRFILEEGAKIVFSLAGKKMRARIEEQSKTEGTNRHDPELPEPKRNL